MKGLSVITVAALHMSSACYASDKSTGKSAAEVTTAGVSSSLQ